MEQLVLELAAPEPPAFENFLAGRNAEVAAAVARFASGAATETGVLLWGTPAAGKTHLLKAAVAAAAARGAVATYFSDPGAFAGGDPDALGAVALLAVDDIDRAEASAQSALFTLYNALRARGGHLIAASRQPLSALPLRDDLRSRLAWGLVYEVFPLADEEKPAALADYARRRGFVLADDVIRYLLLHGRRDMTALCQTLAALDRHSLATKRPVTVPLLRGWLQREMTLDR